MWCCGKSEQEALAEAGACNAAAALLAAASPPSPLTLPTLDWLAAMCFENPAVSQMAVEAKLLCFFYIQNEGGEKTYRTFKNL